jgi:hypothetical protein
MPALAADIEAATRPNGVTLDTQQDSAVLTAYPNARDGAGSPAAGFFDSLTDAATVNAERLTLLKVARRRFATEADRDLDALRGGNLTPVVTAIDAEVSANGAFLVARVAFDLDDDRTKVEIYG